ncbi:MAG: FAD-dependent oxidoreductase, partial [Deltaproteobacteria bacterium]|nr:FAD-dependent oxidoreductase [Deltaproteobacteria bacterium]
DQRVDVLIVGGGPAGLAAALELRRVGIARVVVAEREARLGGIPRHCVHTGFGWRDLRRLLSGPAYAARYVRMADAAGVDLRTETTVTYWEAPTVLGTMSSNGPARVDARAVILATGCRERPRSARLVPGDRPAGVFTTGSLQQLVYLHKQRIGTRAVVIGAEHVSYSAVLTLHHGGAKTLAMVTEHPAHQTYLPFKLLSATRLGVPLLTMTRLMGIRGRQRVEAVDLVDCLNGRRFTIDCDTVVFTGDWIGDHELARRGGLKTDGGTRGPLIDSALRTECRGVFAAGNLLHGAETADVAALSGRHAARNVARFLETDDWPQGFGPSLIASPPIRWISPSAIAAVPPIAPPHGAFLLRVAEFASDAEVVVTQDGRPLWRQHYRRMVPNRPLRLSAAWVRQVDLRGGAIAVELRHNQLA